MSRQHQQGGAAWKTGQTCRQENLSRHMVCIIRRKWVFPCILNKTGIAILLCLPVALYTVHPVSGDMLLKELECTGLPSVMTTRGPRAFVICLTICQMKPAQIYGYCQCSWSNLPSKYHILLKFGRSPKSNSLYSPLITMLSIKFGWIFWMKAGAAVAFWKF